MIEIDKENFDAEVIQSSLSYWTSGGLSAAPALR